MSIDLDPTDAEEVAVEIPPVDRAVSRGVDVRTWGNESFGIEIGAFLVRRGPTAVEGNG